MMGLISIIIILLFIGSITGRTFNLLPFIFFLGVLLVITFGFNVIGFLIANPLLLIIFFIIYFLKKKNTPKGPHSNRNFYYYSSTGSNKEDFEEFFRKASGYSNSGSYTGNGGHIFQTAQSTHEDYENLGIKKGAAKDEIKRAYREKVKENHPDRYPNATETERAYYEKRIKEINESYERISKENN